MHFGKKGKFYKENKLKTDFSKLDACVNIGKFMEKANRYLRVYHDPQKNRTYRLYTIPVIGKTIANVDTVTNRKKYLQIYQNQKLLADFQLHCKGNLFKIEEDLCWFYEYDKNSQKLSIYSYQLGKTKKAAPFRKNRPEGKKSKEFF